MTNEPEGKLIIEKAYEQLRDIMGEAAQIHEKLLAITRTAQAQGWDLEKCKSERLNYRKRLLELSERSRFLHVVLETEEQKREK